MIDGWGISGAIALRWLSLDLNDDKSTLVQVMAWCHQATSHYLSQCWPRSMSPYGIARPQWVNQNIRMISYLFSVWQYFQISSHVPSHATRQSCSLKKSPPEQLWHIMMGVVAIHDSIYYSYEPVYIYDIMGSVGLTVVWTYHKIYSECYTIIILRSSPVTTLPELSKLPWIFPGAPLIFDGAPGNIQGNLTGMHYAM